jgi:acetyl-CoA carboxylase biotin carboxyl carrier protein
MDIRKIKKLIELLEESGVSEIEIKEGEESVRIARNGAVEVQSSSGRPQAIAHTSASSARRRRPPFAALGQRPGRRRIPSAEPQANPGEHIVTAPMVGTYYSAPRPGPSSSSRSAIGSDRPCCAPSRP